MVVVKTDILSYLKKPIHQRWFGKNKTWRGFLVMPIVTWPGVIMAQGWERQLDLNAPLLSPHSSGYLALFLGLAYCLFELPNSFLKRRIGIPEGQTSRKNKWLFVLLDQTDSVFGCVIAYRLFLDISWVVFWSTFFCGIFIHFFINILLYLFKIRKTPL